MSPLYARWWRGRLGYRFLWEVMLIGSMILSYKYVRYLARDAAGPAYENARRVIDFERSVGLAFEHKLQELVLQSDHLIHLINRYYVASHFAVTIAVMFWLYLRRPNVYSRIRLVFVGVTITALVVHVAFPLAPPRMLSGYGFVDTLKSYGPAIYGSPDVGAANQFAAMPSLHFGYAVIAAWGVLLAFRSRWRFVAVLHPVLMLVSIMATANHYWLDAAAAGLALLLIGGAVFTFRRENERPFASPPTEDETILPSMFTDDDTGNADDDTGNAGEDTDHLVDA